MDSMTRLLLGNRQYLTVNRVDFLHLARLDGGKVNHHSSPLTELSAYTHFLVQEGRQSSGKECLFGRLKALMIRSLANAARKGV